MNITGQRDGNGHRCRGEQDISPVSCKDNFSFTLLKRGYKQN
jgi:hypothetical protein